MIQGLISLSVEAIMDGVNRTVEDFYFHTFRKAMEYLQSNRSTISAIEDAYHAVHTAK